MTIKEAAQLYGVSTQAIYQRIAKAGKKAKDLCNGANRDLTEEGAALLSAWFTNADQGALNQPCKRCQELERENAALQAENTALQAQLDAAQADKERLFSLLAQAQQTAQALTVARITAGDDDRPRGILAKWREKWRGNATIRETKV